MITIRVTGKPILTITGENYSAAVQVTAYVDGWAIEQKTITITGLVTSPDPMNTFKTLLKVRADSWRASLSVKEALEAKLAGLEGQSL